MSFGKYSPNVWVFNPGRFCRCLGRSLICMKIISMDINLDLTHRTLGEEIWLWRRRSQPHDRRVFGKIGARLSQREAAEVLGITERTIDDLEHERPVLLDIAK